jgi:hypothetical protein
MHPQFSRTINFVNLPSREKDLEVTSLYIPAGDGDATGLMHNMMGQRPIVNVEN